MGKQFKKRGGGGQGPRPGGAQASEEKARVDSDIMGLCPAAPSDPVALGAQVEALLAEAEELLGNEQYAEGAWCNTGLTLPGTPQCRRAA
jgi:hypothetical protein